MAATEEGPETPTERLDVARGLENVPVSAWPPGAEPEPFQVGGGVRRPSLWVGPCRARALRAQPPRWGWRRFRLGEELNGRVEPPCVASRPGSDSVDESPTPSCLRILGFFSYLSQSSVAQE